MKFTKEHEWVRIEGDIATIGISEYAQEQLGDVVFVELPPVGSTVQLNDETCVIESVKAAGEVKSPLAGEITEVNEKLNDDPALVNSDATGEGWFYKVRMSDPGQADALLSEADYQSLVDSLS